MSDPHEPHEAHEAPHQPHGPLHTMDPTGRFSDRAADYAKFRPSYPREAIDTITAGLLSGASVADVGAGTGIFARLLAERGLAVSAVEPNEAMRSAAAAHERIRWVNGMAEATGLPAASFDLVTCAQAFHWFEPGAALREFHRILKPRGTLALIWNQRDNTDPLTHGYIEAIRAVGGEHPAEARAVDPHIVAADGLFTEPQEHRWPYAQPLTRDGLFGRALSASYTPSDGPSRERLKRILGDFFDQHSRDGVVYLRYTTVAYLATRVD